VAWAIKHFQTNAMTLGTLFFLAGFFFVLGVSRYLRIKEPEALGAIVRQPLYRRIPELFHFPDYRKLCLLGVFANMMLVMMPPACILAARNGWGAGDSLVVVLTTVQALSCICTSLAYKRLGAVFGPRRLLLFCGPLVLSVILFWGLMPLDMPKVFLLIPFILCGMIVVFIGSSLSHYITVTVPVDLQPPGSLGVMIFHGAIAGLLGMVLNYVLFKVLWLLPETTPMTHYRQFFLCCLVLCAFFLFVVSGMPSPRENGGKQFEKCGSRG
jgi:hypothetical protein